VVLAVGVGEHGAWAQVAPADDAVERERTEVYKEGVAFAEAGRWGEALERFQRVVAIRSAPRALLALAAAEEHVGRLVSAKRTYGTARDDARAEGDDALVGKADAALAALDPRIPRLALVVPEGVAGTEARLEGVPLEIAAGGVEIDPGVYHLVVSAPGRRSFEERIVIAAGQKKEVAVELEPSSSGAVAPPLLVQAPVEASPAPAVRRRPPLGAWVLGGVGLATAAVGLIVRSQARSVYDDAAAAGEIDRGNAARNRMIAGTAVAGVGLAGVAAGALWWTLSF
jgi:hypothetical protein